MVQLMPRFAFAALFLLSACEDEAMLHPPTPPSTAIPELGAASQPATAQAASASAPSSGYPTPVMTMSQLMTERIEPEARKAFMSKKPDPVLDRLLTLLAQLAPDDAKFTASPTRSWEALTQNSLRPGRYAQGCRQCHAAYLRPYKRKYHDLTFPVPAD
jgi:hypothetical protein